MQGTNPLTSPGELLIIRGGVDTVWASLTGLAVLAWPLRRTPRLSTPSLRPLWPRWPDGTEAAFGGQPAWERCPIFPGPGRSPAPTSPGIRLRSMRRSCFCSVPGRSSGSKRHGVLAAAMALFWAGLARLATEPLRPSLGANLWWFYGLATVTGLAAAAYLVMKTRKSADKAAVNPYPPG